MNILPLSRRYRAMFAAGALSLPFAATAPASITFTEHYDDLSADSKVTAGFNLAGDFRDDFTAVGRLRGRVDVELVLSDAGPAPRLEAFRVKRITLRMDPLQGSTLGFTGLAQEVGVHMGDGRGGAAGPWASFFPFAGPGVHEWIQDFYNRAAFSGTFRVTGPFGLDELIDCSQLEEPEIPLSGQWELKSLGTESRFSLLMTRFETFKSVPPIPVSLRIALDQTKPFAIPPPPVTYEEWAAARGLTVPNALPDNNPDGDALTNLAEYALDTDPLSAARVPPPVETVLVDGRPAFAFQRRDDRSDLAWHLQFSPDLQEWKTLASCVAGSDAAGVAGGVVLEEKTTATPGTWRIVVRDPAYTPASPKRFARLMIEKL